MLRDKGFQDFVPHLRMDRPMERDVFPAVMATCGQRVFANLHIAVLGHRRHAIRASCCQGGRWEGAMGPWVGCSTLDDFPSRP